MNLRRVGGCLWEGVREEREKLKNELQKNQKKKEMRRKQILQVSK